MTDTPPVDLALLEDYTDTPEELAQYIGIFLDQTGRDLAILSENCTLGESRTWASTAHRMKGGAGMAGAQKLHRLCAEAQAMPMASAEDRTALFLLIEAAIDEIRNYLKQRLSA